MLTEPIPATSLILMGFVVFWMPTLIISGLVVTYFRYWIKTWPDRIFAGLAFVAFLTCVAITFLFGNPLFGPQGFEWLGDRVLTTGFFLIPALAAAMFAGLFFQWRAGLLLSLKTLTMISAMIITIYIHYINLMALMGV